MDTLYQQTLDRCNEPILIIDSTSTILGGNQALLEQFALSITQLRQLPLYDLVTPTDPINGKSYFSQLINDCLYGYKTHSCELLLPANQPAEPAKKALHQCQITPAIQHDGALLCELRLSPANQTHKDHELAITEKNWQLQQIIDAVPHIIYVKDSQGRFVLVNKALAAHYGKQPEQLIGIIQSDLHMAFSRKESTHLAQQDQKVLNQQIFQHIEEEPLTSISGNIRLFETYRIPFRQRNENGLLGVAVDITEKQLAKTQLENVNHRLAAITATMPDLGFVLDEDGYYMDIFGAPKSLLYEDESKLYGRKLSDVLPAKIAASMMAAISKTIDSKHPQIIEYRLNVSAGEKWFEGRTALLPQQPGERPTVVWLSRDISGRKQAEVQAHYLAYHDALTGLPNRSLLLDRIEQALSRTRREQNLAAVLFIDLDHFKNINDSLGHAVGDQLLEQVALRIRRNIRDVDTVGRLGGDEFVVVLSDIGKDVKTARENTTQLALKLRKELCRPFNYSGHDLSIAASIGVVTIPDKYISADEILGHADTAMYDAKAKGRNKLVFFEPEMASTVQRRLKLENDLRKALDQQELEIYYQPKVSIKSGMLSGAECLLRWKHPEWGDILPIEFIPILEETGLIIPAGEWILKHATKQLKHWIKLGIWNATQQMSINISPRQFLQADFSQILIDIVKEAQVPSTCIDLEITESMVIHNIEDAVKKMEKIRQLGFSFSIDDFGTGYSSLTYLKRLPVDTLKIDRTFIRDLMHDPDDAAIVETILNIAKRFKLDVVAEGVETSEQMECLRKWECEQCQGFLLSKPLPFPQFEQLLVDLQKQDKLLTADYCGG
jgi:diguanylate cyclase (GGDEF)-like protein/PAS domain S-box-containing protein